MWTSKYFTLEEMKCRCGKCGSDGSEMKQQFMDKLDAAREKFGPITIASPYRCPAYNERVSTTGPNGPHTTGRASDVVVSREDAYKLLQIAYEVGFTGIGVKQTGISRYLHFDDLTQAEGYPRPTVWSY